MSSKNIHEGNSLRDVLRESVSLLGKGDHGRLVGQKSVSNFGRNSDALNGDSRESATFRS